MNRRAFLTGLIATTALAPCAIAVDAVIASTPALDWKTYIEQWYSDASDVMIKVCEDQIIWGVGAWRNIETYPFIERIDPHSLPAPPKRGGLFND